MTAAGSGRPGPRPCRLPCRPSLAPLRVRRRLRVLVFPLALLSLRLGRVLGLRRVVLRELRLARRRLDLPLAAPAFVQEVHARVVPRITDARLARLQQLHDLLDEAVEELSELVERKLATPGRIDDQHVVHGDEPVQVIPGEEDMVRGDVLRMHEVAHDQLRDQIQVHAPEEDLAKLEIGLIFMLLLDQGDFLRHVLEGVRVLLLPRLALAVKADERVKRLLVPWLHLFQARRFELPLLVVVRSPAQGSAARAIVVVDDAVLDLHDDADAPHVLILGDGLIVGRRGEHVDTLLPERVEAGADHDREEAAIRNLPDPGRISLKYRTQGGGKWV